MFTCGDVIDPWVAHKVLRAGFKARRESVIELKRGLLDVPAGTLPTEYNVKAKP